MTDEQTAAAIGRMCNIDKHEVDEVEAAIVRALQAARKAPPGHIIDDAGVVRKVLRVKRDNFSINGVEYFGAKEITVEAAEAAKEGKA